MTRVAHEGSLEPPLGAECEECGCPPPVHTRSLRQQPRTHCVMTPPGETFSEAGAAPPVRPAVDEGRQFRELTLNFPPRFAPAPKHIRRICGQGTWSHPVPHQIFRNICDFGSRGDPELEEQVLPAHQLLVITADLLDRRTKHQCRAVRADQAFVDSTRKRVKGKPLVRSVASHPALRVDVADEGVDERCARVTQSDVNLPLDLAGMPDIVGVEARDIVAPYESKSCVERCRHSAVGLAVEVNARIGASKRLRDRERVVCRTVIDDDQLDVRVGTGECRLNGLAQRRLRIVRGNNHGNQWLVGCGSGDCLTSFLCDLALAGRPWEAPELAKRTQAREPKGLKSNPPGAFPLVSVVVPAFNAEATLAETLESVAAQTYPNLEIIIVDDGSTDSTAAVAGAFCEIEPRARLIRQKNAGVAAARNMGIAVAAGEWIAPMDADDLWHPTKIEKQLSAALAAAKKPGLVYCWFHYIDGESRVVGSSARWEAKGRAFNQMACYNFVGNGSAPLLLREAVMAVGGYDTSLRAEQGQGCEDLLLQLQIARTYLVAAVPEHLVGYRVGSGGMSRNAEQMRKSWQLVFERVRFGGSPVSNRAVRWAMGMRTFEFAEMRALAGDRFGAAQLLARAFRIDPLRCSLQLAYRAARLAARLVRGRRPPPLRRHFSEVAPTDHVRVDKDELEALARTLERLERRRLTRLAVADLSEESIADSQAR